MSVIRAMKDSGVAWIGAIPQGWEIKRMKDCFISNSRPQPNNTVLSLSYGKVIVKDMEEKKGVTPESYDSYQGVHPGDVVLRLTDLQNDQKSLRVGRATTKGIITSAYLCVSSRSLNDRYSAYLLHDVGDIQKLFYGLGGGVRQSMKFADLAELLFSLPPPPEQLAIADYLDRQTVLIDQRLTTLADKKTVLAELRKATIHEAVTKGMNKTAAMKESGVAWIGEIPQGWAVLRGKDVFVKHSLPAFDTDEIVTCFRDGQVTLRKNRREDGFTIALKEHGYQGVRVGDLVVHAMDAFAGAIGISESNGKCSPVYSICRARQSTKTDLRFYSYVLRDMALNGYIQSVGQGIRERSTDFRFREVEVAFYCQPTLHEQRTIANHLDQQTQQFDAQLATLGEQAQVLKELRKAIIHEAVTGKIDLSGRTPPQPQQALAA